MGQLRHASVVVAHADLNKTLTTDEHFDPVNIHRFDCTEEHMGGAGGAAQWLDAKGSEFGDAWLGAPNPSP